MATVRSFNQPFELTELTQEALIIPNTWGLINELGIFSEESVTQHNISVETTNGTIGLIGDRVRGDRNNANKDDVRALRSFPIPHFPLDDAIKPEDVQGKRAFGNVSVEETEAAVMARKLERIRRNHAITLEFARAYALTTGQIYAPNGTVSGSFFTDFGVTRKEIDFVLGTSTTNLTAKIEEGIANGQDQLMSGEVVTDFVALCSPEFFSKLIDHASVKESWKYYTSIQEPLRNRLGSGVYRRLVWQGVEWVEYRGSYNGSRLIPAGDAVLVPRGTSETFKTYFSPANRFDYVNTLGESVYVWSQRNPANTEITVSSESNFLNLIRRPGCIARLYSSN